MRITVAINEYGSRIGEFHQNAKLSENDLELLLQLRAAGWGYRRLAAKFEIAKRTVRDYCAGRRRHQIPMAWKVIERPDDGASQ